MITKTLIPCMLGIILSAQAARTDSIYIETTDRYLGARNAIRRHGKLQSINAETGILTFEFLVPESEDAPQGKLLQPVHISRIYLIQWGPIPDHTIEKLAFKPSIVNAMSGVDIHNIYTESGDLRELIVKKELCQVFPRLSCSAFDALRKTVPGIILSLKNETGKARVKVQEDTGEHVITDIPLNMIIMWDRG